MLGLYSRDMGGNFKDPSMAKAGIFDQWIKQSNIGL